MAKVSGLGGYWVVSGSPNITVHNSEYEYETDGEIDDVTDSSSVGWRQGLPIIKKMASATITIPEDDAGYPEAAGLVENAVLDIWFKRGAKALYDKVVGTIVKSVRVMNDQTKARRVVITTEYGAFTRSAAPPA